MGIFGWTEVHPFTIASASGGAEGLVLMCKAGGKWTSRLYEAAKGGCLEDGPGRNVSIVIQGPYGMSLFSIIFFGPF
jgi:predicted ferric reductase